MFGGAYLGFLVLGTSGYVLDTGTYPPGTNPSGSYQEQSENLINQYTRDLVDAGSITTDTDKNGEYTRHIDGTGTYGVE